MIRHQGRNLLVDTSTDLRIQALTHGINAVDAVLFTHAHADHVNGIDDLRGFYFLHRKIVPCYASGGTLKTLQAGFRYIFQEHESSGYSPLLTAHEIKAPFDLFDLNIVPVPLIHGKTTALGYRIGSFAYLTDCSAIPDSSMELLAGLQLLIIDGLRWTGHPFHFNIEGAITVARKLSVPRVVLTHLTHEIAYSDNGRLPPGFEFAYDGMQFDLFSS
jgi:phosphoribosyl 1,2-cyclic phosphate phosphodiesterase